MRQPPPPHNLEYHVSVFIPPESEGNQEKYSTTT
jgi:hypothetical protein